MWDVLIRLYSFGKSEMPFKKEESKLGCLNKNIFSVHCLFFECMLGTFKPIYFVYRSMFALVNTISGAIFFVNLYTSSKRFCDKHGCSLQKLRVNRNVTFRTFFCENLVCKVRSGGRGRKLEILENWIVPIYIKKFPHL